MEFKEEQALGPEGVEEGGDRMLAEASTTDTTRTRTNEDLMATEDFMTGIVCLCLFLFCFLKTIEDEETKLDS